MSSSSLVAAAANDVTQRRVVVIDNGSFNIRGGLSGDFRPGCQTRNVVGHWRAEASEAWKKQVKCFHGDEAVTKHSQLMLEYTLKGS